MTQFAKILNPAIVAPALREAVAPFIAMDVKREASLLEQAGAGIVHMEVGEPCAPPPRRVREAAIAALGGQPVGYTDALGLGALRERIALHYREAYGVGLDPQRVAVTTGSSGGFVMAFLALFDAGARVAIQNPGCDFLARAGPAEAFWLWTFVITSHCRIRPRRPEASRQRF